MKIQGFSRTVNTLHALLFHSTRISILSDRLQTLISEGIGLDIGTGDGKIPEILMKKNPEIKILGLELSDRCQKSDNVIVYDGKRIPFKDKSVDFIMLVDVLHHIENPGELLRECLRVAKKKILIKDHLCENKRDLLRLKLMDWVGNVDKGVALPYHYLSLKQWTDLFKQSGVQKFNHQKVCLYRGIIALIAGGHLQVIFELVL